MVGIPKPMNRQITRSVLFIVGYLQGNVSILGPQKRKPVVPA
jgi:hypothetical protein